MYWLIPTTAAAALAYYLKNRSTNRSSRACSIVIAGPVNAGKSTLFRALTGLDPGVIDPREGWNHNITTATTEDNVSLSDYPGFGDPENSKRGYELGSADLIVLMADRFDDTVINELHRLSRLATNLILVRSKIDKIHKRRRKEVLNHIRSELRKRGLQRISVTCVCGGPRVGEVGTPAPPQKIKQLKRLITRKIREVDPSRTNIWRGTWILDCSS